MLFLNVQNMNSVRQLKAEGEVLSPMGVTVQTNFPLSGTVIVVFS